MKKILLILVGYFLLCINLGAQTRRDGEFLFNEERYGCACGVAVNHAADNLHTVGFSSGSG